MLLAHNQPADPEKAFRVSEKLRSQGVEIITVAIHTKKTTTLLNPQYRALASSSSCAHSFDFSKLLESSMDILLNLCELNSCPKGMIFDPKKIEMAKFIATSLRSIQKLAKLQSLLQNVVKYEKYTTCKACNFCILSYYARNIYTTR